MGFKLAGLGLGAPLVGGPSPAGVCPALPARRPRLGRLPPKNAPCQAAPTQHFPNPTPLRPRRPRRPQPTAPQKARRARRRQCRCRRRRPFAFRRPPSHPAVHLRRGVGLWGDGPQREGPQRQPAQHWGDGPGGLQRQARAHGPARERARAPPIAGRPRLRRRAARRARAARPAGGLFSESKPEPSAGNQAPTQAHKRASRSRQAPPASAPLLVPQDAGRRDGRQPL